jgi:hypothetical protein
MGYSAFAGDCNLSHNHKQKETQTLNRILVRAFFLGLEKLNRNLGETAYPQPQALFMGPLYKGAIVCSEQSNSSEHGSGVKFYSLQVLHSRFEEV